MAKSGVKIDDLVTSTYEAVKTIKKCRWMLMEIKGPKNKSDKSDQKVVVEETFDKTDDQVADFQELRQRLMTALEKKECRYAVVDLAFSLGDSGDRSKLCLINWTPDESMVRQRMVYASTLAGLKAALGEGLSTTVQANDASDLALDDIIADLKKGK